MKRLLLFILIPSMLFLGCQSEPVSEYTYRPPKDVNDGLNASALEEVNIDAALIEKAVSEIHSGKYKEVHSMLVFKDDKLVLEEYFEGHTYQWDAPDHHGEVVTWDKSMLHEIHSDTKSITSICIGITIDNGFIESVHQSIFDYLPEHQYLNTDGKDKITIEHLLTMTSGLEWDEWSAPLSSINNDIVGIWFHGQEDPIAYVLERPLVHEPGTSFNYSGGNMFVLGEIIKNATGMDIDEFSGKYLFGPLGIDSYDWSIRYVNGEIDTGGSLRITPRAMTKIGVTFLNEGIWEGKQIISPQWVAKSAITFGSNEGINIPGEDSGSVGYSYSWWTKQYPESGGLWTCQSPNSAEKINMYYAGGWGGQHIMVMPELNMVVVFTGGNYLTFRPPFKILEDYIIPASIKP